MHHQIHRIIACRVLPPYGLKLKFDDGLEREVDLESILEGEIYGPLRDQVFFSKVVIDPEIHTITWPNGADFDPAILHDWSIHLDSFVEAAKSWKQSSSFPKPAFA